MTDNRSGPETVATAFEVLVSEVLDSTIDARINPTTGTTQAEPADGAGQFYVASDIKSKRPRRTKAAMTGVRAAITDILSKDNPQTVRQVFYALTVRGVIAKAEIEYQRTVVRLLGEMREAGTIPFAWIADNTRWQRKPTT